MSINALSGERTAASSAASLTAVGAAPGPAPDGVASRQVFNFRMESGSTPNIIHRLLEVHSVQLQIKEDITAKNHANEEEITAKNCVDEEAKNHAIEEEIAAKNRVIEEAKNHDIEEEIAAKNRAIEKEIAAKNRVIEEEIAATNRVEEDKNHDIEEEGTTKSCTPTEEIQPQDGTPDDQLMMETDGICVPDSNLHQTDGFLEESLPSVTSSVKESTFAEVMMVQAGTPDEKLGDENRDQSMMENDDTRVPDSNLDQTDGILEEPYVKEGNERLGDENQCVPDSNLDQTADILEKAICEGR